MHEQNDGVIEQLTLQRTRPRREPPKHRPAAGAARPVSLATPAPQPVTVAGEHAQPAERPADAKAVADGRTEQLRETPRAADPLRLAVDEPLTNYAVRVRRTLDDLLAWQLAQLRRHGTRTTKVELTELLLWELAQDDLDDVAERLRAFRHHAPR